MTTTAEDTFAMNAMGTMFALLMLGLMSLVIIAVAGSAMLLAKLWLEVSLLRATELGLARAPELGLARAPDARSEQERQPGEGRGYKRAPRPAELNPQN